MVEEREIENALVEDVELASQFHALNFIKDHLDTGYLEPSAGVIDRILQFAAVAGKPV